MEEATHWEWPYTNDNNIMKSELVRIHVLKPAQSKWYHI